LSPDSALLVAAISIAIANGANDNFKGVATLFGSGTTSYRRALLWATITTSLGSLTALFLAGSLVARFSGRGLVPDAITGQTSFLFAVAGGAAITVFFASCTGFPISTTHALTGALVGAGLVAAPADFRFAALGSGFIAPLLISPVVAAVIVGIIHRLFPVKKNICLCFAQSAPMNVNFPIVAPVSECAVHGLAPKATTHGLIDSAHYLSAGAVSYARGVNDTPKMLALLLPVSALSGHSATVLIGAAIAVGGLAGARRVAETMSHRVTTMNPHQGLIANCATALLVLTASPFGLPVSTTHVSSGALFGLGAVTGQARTHAIVQIILSWVLTLPCAAAFAGLLICLAP